MLDGVVGSQSQGAVARCRSYALPVGELAESTVDLMWHIFRRYYDIECKAEFIDSLREKDVAFILEDRDTGAIVGFTSVLVMRFARYSAIHSGDTMVEPSYWGAGKHFAYQMAKLMTKLYASKPGHPLYWFLISQGYRTYLTMARNMIEFYPTWRAPTPPWARRIIEEVARYRYGEAYQPDTGRLVFPHRRKPLRSWVAPVTENDLADRDIAYFVRSNPGWDDGNELPCLGVVNLRLLAWLWPKLTAVLVRSWLTRLPRMFTGV
jgi:hypothetical protein